MFTRQMGKKWAGLAALALLGACSSALCAAPEQALKITMPRHAYYRGEDIPLTVIAPGAGNDARAVVSLGETVVLSEAALAGPETILAVPTAQFKAGSYALKVVVRAGGAELAAADSVVIARRPSEDRFDVWLWSYGGSDYTFYFDHGFTIAGGPCNVHQYARRTEKSVAQEIKLLDERLARGVYATVSPCGGITRRELSTVATNADDVAYKGAGRNTEHYYNPFSPIVEKARSEENAGFMKTFGFHPAVKVAFFNTELVDDLWLDNLNHEGVERTRRLLGFTRDERGAARFIAPGVIADDDRGYAFLKYVVTEGNGLAYANRKTSEDIKRFRPDVLTLTDPYRAYAFLNMFPGIDLVSTWTYTNNDPKRMYYIETMRAVTRGTGQRPLQTVTLLNYPGTLAPRSLTGESSTKEWFGSDPKHAGWMLMGPDRCKEVSWIILSRAPRMIGYYYSSACDPQKHNKPEDQFRVPYATSLAIKELSERVFAPYGPMITKLSVAPRNIAVLSSQASRLYGKSAGSGYGNEQIYDFYSLLAMSHLSADVVFDEQVEAGALKDYAVLVMPFCGVVTKKMHGEILAFAKRGGIVVADSHLGPDIPGAIKFSFDFSYRNKVNADAIESGAMFAEWDDHLDPKTAELAKAKGVTAEDDQKIMESYARRLKEGLAGKVKPAVWTDSPRALVNVLENDGVRYLVLINDHRGYGERVGRFKAIMEKLLPQTVTVSVRSPNDTPHAYDMLERRALEVSRAGDTIAFKVGLDALGGKIIALCPRKPESLAISVKAPAALGKTAIIAVEIRDADGKALPGLQPLRIKIFDPEGAASEFSDYYCAQSGRLEVRFAPALNDLPGDWRVEAEDLTSGLKADASFQVVQ